MTREVIPEQIVAICDRCGKKEEYDSRQVLSNTCGWSNLIVWKVGRPAHDEPLPGQTTNYHLCDGCTGALGEFMHGPSDNTDVEPSGNKPTGGVADGRLYCMRCGNMLCENETLCEFCDKKWDFKVCNHDWVRTDTDKFECSQCGRIKSVL